MILPKESATFSSCRFNFFRANKICFLSRTRVDSMSMYDNVKSDIAENCDEYYSTPRISWALFALFISHVAHYAPSSQDKNHLKLWAWPLTDIVEPALNILMSSLKNKGSQKQKTNRNLPEYLPEGCGLFINSTLRKDHSLALTMPVTVCVLGVPSPGSSEP